MAVFCTENDLKDSVLFDVIMFWVGVESVFKCGRVCVLSGGDNIT